MRLVVAVGFAALALLLAYAADGATPAPSWTTFGESTARLGQTSTAAPPSRLTRRFVLPLSGRITSQVLSSGGVFVATSTGGDVVAFDRNGFVLWHDRVGQLAHACPQLDGYGVVGTGAVDPSSRTLYVADAFGRLHALALSTGAERRGWPIRVFADGDRELDWGALTLAGGSVYVPTAAYCDAAGTPGGIYRVNLATKTVGHWLAVPLDQGGGGGPWGWGGLAWDPAANLLYAATSGAFSGGSNSGSSYTETAGYGDRLIAFGPDLQVRSSSHPVGLPDRQDLDFVGSPLLVDVTSCGPMVVAATKNDTVYGWRRDEVASGWAWKVAIEPYAIDDPFVAQVAWSTATSSVYAATGTELVRIRVGAGCKASVVWRRPLGTRTENGSPTVAGNVVWFAQNGKQRLLAYDATTGRRLLSVPLGGTTLQAPTIVAGRVIVGTFSGVVEGFATAGDALASTGAHGATSWADAKHGWQSRAGGVYATDDGGKRWRRVYARPALAVLRVSATAGVIATGSAPGTCMCSTRQLWTSDAGRTWHDTRTLSGNFAAGGGRIYFWQKGTLRLLAPLPARGSGTRLGAQTVASVASGTIVGAAPVAGGVVALVSNRVGGQGWDNAPRVLVASGSTAGVVALPGRPGNPLVQTITAAGKRLTVTAVDFTEQPARTLTWTSTNGGATWKPGG
ncbi:MAG TPA: PQQ-binding-like beta-propeller repeat protein [Gaiellaceae bacterium]